MTRMAAGPESMDVEDWMPSKIYLSVPLMWEILQFDFADDAKAVSAAGLLDASLVPAMAHEDVGASSMLEIVVATSPEITINTADGGQQAPTFSYKPPAPSSTRNSPRSAYRDEDSLAFHFTPWLYANSTHFSNLEDMSIYDAQPAVGENRSMAWWEDDSLGNLMFNSF